VRHEEHQQHDPEPGMRVTAPGWREYADGGKT